MRRDVPGTQWHQSVIVFLFTVVLASWWEYLLVSSQRSPKPTHLNSFSVHKIHFAEVTGVPSQSREDMGRGANPSLQLPYHTAEGSTASKRLAHLLQQENSVALAELEKAISLPPGPWPISVLFVWSCFSLRAFTVCLPQGVNTTLKCCGHQTKQNRTHV